jgi:DNA-binding NarL/FixJ family response regulator
MVRVVIADDQVLLREGFRALLEAGGDIEVVGEAGDGMDAVELARRRRPDVIVMDVRMPRMDGIEATERITTAAGNVSRVLILTTFGEDEYVYRALRAGAAGFLLKDAERADLVDAVRAVAAGDRLLSPGITRRLIEEFVRRRPPSRGTPPELTELTERELDIMRLVARGLSNTEIANHLVVSTGTVKTHVAHILQKLALRDRTQIVVLAYESGLTEPGAASS